MAINSSIIKVFLNLLILLGKGKRLELHHNLVRTIRPEAQNWEESIYQGEEEEKRTASRLTAESDEDRPNREKNLRSELI
jgi:hypothetical protein